MGERSVFKSAAARERVLGEYEAVLGRWPLPLERRAIETGAGRTALLAFGPGEGGGAEGPPLLLLHGTGSNSSMWVGEAAVLGRDRRVYALDIPGEPGMSAEAWLDWSGSGAAGRYGAAAWLGEAVEGLGLGGRPHDLVGLSIGGWIGLAYAIGRPAGLGSLVLLAPSGIGRPRGSFILRALLAGLRGAAGAESLLRSLYGEEEPHPEAIRVGLAMAESTNPRMEAPRLFGDGELGGIAARVFLAAGEGDLLLRSGESVERLGRLLPGSERRLLPGKGHALAGLGPEIVGFLDRGA